MQDTIFALSSGRPPAAIAIVRISGPHAVEAATALAGPLPPPRRAGLRRLRAADGQALDDALVLVFPGPATATGEDLVELHCHGGRAVVAGIEAALGASAGLRLAESGEFTRRALTNGRIDLAEAEGLGDLLAAQTEGQRVAALAAAEGRVSRAVRAWLAAIATLSARVEAVLDFSDEGDVADDDAVLAAVARDMAALGDAIDAVLAAPPVERLHDGIRVVLAGPPNAGKSTLLNLLAGRDAAIVSPISGTTRDRIEVPVVRAGIAYLLTDTAGLADATDDPVEAIGIERATAAMAAADLLVWLGDDDPPRKAAIVVQPRADLPGRGRLRAGGDLLVSQADVGSIERLWAVLGERAAALLPRRDAVALRERQRGLCAAARDDLSTTTTDALVMAEHLRRAHRSLAAILGIDATEAMLDALFSGFCLGK
ncbi:tRNA uridine-5-carboxymethylaminomethyl(34) synthesis GTPase MnmE [uncultured Sphingomonas sp.]|uniref:tRNA uridine-5-carboxymethylaminomethyl(34) synthesis GTPase MnmE n=1 Tax=uncultured Sphingomonas sp. TaxID=158754 RepID=UPI0035C9FDBB